MIGVVGNITGFSSIFATLPKYVKQKAYCFPYIEVKVCTVGAMVM